MNDDARHTGDRPRPRTADRRSRRALLRAGTVAGASVLAGCFERDGSDATDRGPRPVTGDEVAELAALDGTVREYMRDLEIDAGVLGVSSGGEIVLQRGYGWADPDRTVPIDPNAAFRIGSISKAFTDAAIERLRRDGQLALEDRVLPLLDVEPPRGEPADDRFHDVRIGHLLEHAGGWNQFVAGDPLYRPVEVAAELDLDRPPDKYDVTRYMLDRPLQFDPGERTVYSNFGYCLLGQVVEAVTGTEYRTYLADALFGPIGVDGVTVGRTRPGERRDDEIWYDDRRTCPDAFGLDPDAEVPCADAGFVLESFDAAAGYVASTGPLLAYLDAYWLSGDRREPGTDPSPPTPQVQYGSHPGSFAVARQAADRSIVAMFNRRTHPIEASTAIEAMLAATIDEIEAWP